MSSVYFNIGIYFYNKFLKYINTYIIEDIISEYIDSEKYIVSYENTLYYYDIFS